MTRTELHELIDRLPENLLEPVERLARDLMMDAIPEEEEEVSPEEAAAIDEALEDYRLHGGTPHAEVVASLKRGNQDAY